MSNPFERWADEQRERDEWLYELESKIYPETINNLEKLIKAVKNFLNGKSVLSKEENDLRLILLEIEKDQ